MMTGGDAATGRLDWMMTATAAAHPPASLRSAKPEGSALQFCHVIGCGERGRVAGKGRVSKWKSFKVSRWEPLAFVPSKRRELCHPEARPCAEGSMQLAGNA